MSRPDAHHGPPERGAAGSSPGQVDWTRLPDPLRSRLAEIAATALGSMPAADIPVPLRRFARFTPAKRAKLGASAITAELARSEEHTSELQSRENLVCRLLLVQ